MTEETKLTVNMEMGHGKARFDAGVQIRFHRAWYAISNNPLEVWRALALCNDFDIPAPDWASEYLERVTAAIAGVEPSKRFAFNLAEAMEFSGDPPTQHKKLMRRRKVIRWLLDQASADEIADAHAMQQHFLDALIEFGAEVDVKDERTIASWWREFHPHFIHE
jgi:hypothetical protein